MGVSEQVIAESRQSGSETCENRIPGNGWVVGSNLSGRNFYQNRVGGSHQVIREKLGQKKTRDRVGVCERVIGKRSIWGREIWGSDCYGGSNQVASHWGASHCRARKFGRK